MEATEKSTPPPLNAALRPLVRKLRGYAYDPSLSISLDAVLVNRATFQVKWEELEPGPIGEYVEVIDADPSSRAFYLPVNLNDPAVLAQDGLPPSESNPQFHQQMVYAVVMTTIQNFEKALGRKAFWSSINYEEKDETQAYQRERFVQRLRIYPHAVRQANAYYSPDKKALLFGYFPARPSNETLLMPGSLVFTCLSHDIVAHEVTHALIDGLRKRFVYAYHPDTTALHEAFSDLVALFQHFTFPEALEHQIAKSRGELENEHLLGQLAQQFGFAIGNYGALRDAIGHTNESGDWVPLEPNASAYKTVMKPHQRGSILVATVFSAFLNVYRKRVADLFRIATNGTGVLPQGNIHPDLVTRLAYEASRTARHFLSMLIRALDYCPPVYVTFGDFLRAIVTADLDLVPNDPLGYRVAFIESFKRRGIYPDGIRTLSEENLSYTTYQAEELTDLFSPGQTDQTAGSPNLLIRLRERLRLYFNEASNDHSRRDLFQLTLIAKEELHRLVHQADEQERRMLEHITELTLSMPEMDYPIENALVVERILPSEPGEPVRSAQVDMKIYAEKNAQGEEKHYYCPSFEIHSLHRSQRVGPDNVILNQVILTLVQTCRIVDPSKPAADVPEFRSGCTLVLDMDRLTLKVMAKATRDKVRLDKFMERLKKVELTPESSPFNAPSRNHQLAEPFAALHER